MSGGFTLGTMDNLMLTRVANLVSSNVIANYDRAVAGQPVPTISRCPINIRNSTIAGRPTGRPLSNSVARRIRTDIILPDYALAAPEQHA